MPRPAGHATNACFAIACQASVRVFRPAVVKWLGGVQAVPRHRSQPLAISSHARIRSGKVLLQKNPTSTASRRLRRGGAATATASSSACWWHADCLVPATQLRSSAVCMSTPSGIGDTLRVSFALTEEPPVADECVRRHGWTAVRSEKVAATAEQLARHAHVLLCGHDRQPHARRKSDEARDKPRHVIRGHIHDRGVSQLHVRPVDVTPLAPHLVRFVLGPCLAPAAVDGEACGICVAAGTHDSARPNGHGLRRCAWRRRVAVVTPPRGPAAGASPQLARPLPRGREPATECSDESDQAQCGSSLSRGARRSHFFE
eukprot:3757524-Prymnesium_polylepis.1